MAVLIFLGAVILVAVVVAVWATVAKVEESKRELKRRNHQLAELAAELEALAIANRDTSETLADVILHVIQQHRKELTE